jgi:diacylglycerol kinase family enzyme
LVKLIAGIIIFNFLPGVHYLMRHDTLFIFNPIANLGRAWPVASNIRRVADELGGADWSGTVYPGHAAEIAENAARQGYKRVVATGGDGTIHEVINGLMAVEAEKRPLLGIVPVGSGNDFAGTLKFRATPKKPCVKSFPEARRVLMWLLCKMTPAEKNTG